MKKVYLVKKEDSDLVVGVSFQKTDIYYGEVNDDLTEKEIHNILGLEDKKVYYTNGGLIEEKPKAVTETELTTAIAERQQDMNALEELLFETQEALADALEFILGGEL